MQDTIPPKNPIEIKQNMDKYSVKLLEANIRSELSIM